MIRNYGWDSNCYHSYNIDNINYCYYANSYCAYWCHMMLVTVASDDYYSQNKKCNFYQVSFKCITWPQLQLLDFRSNTQSVLPVLLSANQCYQCSWALTSATSATSAIEHLPTNSELNVHFSMLQACRSLHSDTRLQFCMRDGRGTYHFINLITNKQIIK